MSIFDKISTLINACNEINIQPTRWKVSYSFGASSRAFKLMLTREYQKRPDMRFVDHRVLYTDMMTDNEFLHVEQWLADIMLKVLNEVKDDGRDESLDHLPEPEIGDILILDGKHYETVEACLCVGCDLRKTSWCGEYRCDDIYREDFKSIKFIEVEDD